MANILSFNQVEQVVNNYAANHASTRMGHNFVCVVSLKKDKVYASGSHLIGHVAKVTMVNHCVFPKYDSKVAAATGMDITPNKLNGMVWVNYPYIKQAIKSGYRYLNIYYAMSDVRMETTTKWLVDGREATTSEVAEIEMHLRKSNNNAIVKAAMYQIDVVNDWDGFYYFGESKEQAKQIFEQIGK
jgi:hypothetical protein